jgi:hypothetical protein
LRRSARRPSRGVVFGFVVALCMLAAGSYVAVAVVRGGPEASGDPNARLGRSPVVVFQHVRRDAGYAHVAMAPANGSRGRRITPLRCERVHYAANRGLCLMPEEDLLGPKFKAMIFGPDFRVRREISLAGIITRARVSPDGRYGVATGFVMGHSYAADDFSTQTSLIDMATGSVIADLEAFQVTLDGRRVRPRDRNFWGVTFARDGNRFYATMRTGGRTYLVEGDIGRRELRALRENVECPSLSPDETRVAYKKRMGSGGDWRLYVLDLRTMQETALAEGRPIDDQAEWLDDGRVLYGLDGHVWSVPADGSGRPRVLFSDALSPAVQR